jgi:hypothetical protein
VAEDLVRATALSVTTIRRAELTEDETSMTAANDLAVRLNKCLPTTPSPQTRDDRSALLLWQRSAVLAGMKENGAPPL